MWHYLHRNAQLGPLDEGTMGGLIKEGTITLDTLVWKEGMRDWVPAPSTDLVRYFPKPSPPQETKVHPWEVVTPSISSLVPATNDALRFFALLIDAGIIWLVYYALSLVMDLSSSKTDLPVTVGVVVVLMLRDSIFPGGSVGKRTCGLILLDVQIGQPLGPWRACLRQLYFYLSMALIFGIIFGIGHLSGSKVADGRAVLAAIWIPLAGQVGKAAGRSIFDKYSHAMLAKTRAYRATLP